MYSWIRKERGSRKLSQSKLSQLTGISQQYLSAWEHKKSTPTPQQEQVIRKAFRNYDEMLENGKHAEFHRKTRWSKDYEGTSRKNPSKKPISVEEMHAFANSATHTLRSPQRFSGNREDDLHVTGISLFSGCGGLTMGFHEADVKIIGHVEIEDSFRNVFERNFPDSTKIGQDIRSVSDENLWKWKQILPDIHIIFGGPPCQGFSLTGKRDVYDPRNQLYKDFARFVRIIRPRAFVLENVRLLTSMKMPDGALLINDLVETFESIGYSVDYAELNAQNYGVPQFRERVFVIGLDNAVYGETNIMFPKPSHLDEQSLGLFDADIARHQTLRDAIGDLEKLESGESSQTDPLHFAVSHPTHVIEMLKDVPEGCSAHDNPNPELRPKSGYNTTYKRLRWDEPSSTISTTFGMISGSRNVHPTATRSLTIREALRCQSFPDDFIIFGSLGEIRTMIGNALPPKFAYPIANHVITKYLNEGVSGTVGQYQVVEVASL